MKVVDTKASEVGMQRKRSASGQALHCCCVCRRINTWTDSWSWYGSEKDLDDGTLIAKVCSDVCRAKAGPDGERVTVEMKEAAKAAEMRDPIIVYRDATDAEKYAAAVGKQRQGTRPL